MKPSLAGVAFAIVLLLVVIVGYSTLFTVNQTKQALVVRLGEPVRVITEPGLNVKVPFIDSVIYVDKRILDLEIAGAGGDCLRPEASRRRRLRALSRQGSAQILPDGRRDRRELAARDPAQLGAAARARRGHTDRGRARRARSS